METKTKSGIWWFAYLIADGAAKAFAERFPEIWEGLSD
jgi:hypothetical protein